MEKEWYVVNTYSGHENKVKEKLDMRAESMDMQNNIFRVIVPEQTEVEVKDGVEKSKVKKMFPGYILVEMVMSDEAWYVVRNTPGVTGFIGSSGRGAKPFPVPKEQIESVLKGVGIVEEGMYSDYNPGDLVKILRGPLMGSEGTILNVDIARKTVRVSSLFFGRETIVEVDFADVDKVNE